MNLPVQKRLASEILNVSKKKIWIDPSRLDEAKEAITKIDVKKLICEGIVREKPSKNTSRGRARKIKIQKSKGRRKGSGSRKGKNTARLPKKKAWMNTIRVQRKFLKELKDKKIIVDKAYRDLYIKSKGGFFRSKRHIKLYIEEHKLVKQKTK